MIGPRPRQVFRRQLRLLAPHRWWIVAGVLLGFLAIGSSIGLMAVSAWLISRAAVISSVADVAIAITAVRVLAISRAAFRYLERYVTHRATFRILADLRVWFFDAIEPLAPARLEGHRSGDLMTRIATDIDSLEDLYVRVVVPPLVAALVCAFGALLLGVFDPLLGAVLLGFLVLTGVVLPWCSRWIGRQPARELVAVRSELNGMLVDQVQGVADLVAFDRAEQHRGRALELGDELDRIGQRLALVRGMGAGLGALLASLAGITLLGIAIPLVTGAQLDGVYLALIPLAAVATFEAVQPLTQSMQSYDSTTAAGARLFELIDAPPPVIEPPRPAALPTSHDVVIAGLGFRYAAGEPRVLDGLDLVDPIGWQPRPGRAQRCRQDDPGGAAAALPGTRGGVHPHRRPGHPRVRVSGCALDDRRRAPAHPPVQRHHPGQPRGRSRRGHGRGDGRRMSGRADPRLRARRCPRDTRPAWARTGCS